MTRQNPTIEDLLAIMAQLRAKDGGCPWDVEQTFETIAPYTIEEAYEVAEAITEKDMDSLKDELGDVLFQVVFHSRMAEEAGDFTFDDVVETVCDKMIRRHPHVFGDKDVADAEAQTVAWEEHKAKERAKAGSDSVLSGVTKGLPALVRALKLQNRAARVGFDWGAPEPVLEKLNEEMAELAMELVERSRADENLDRIEDEFGDILFVYVNLARHLKIDPETALRRTNFKFERRFRRIEQALSDAGKRIEDASLDEMEALWQAAKTDEPTTV
ncbi:MAG TPA: nucleoside triphosphate pyrophosphohydrolase [Alphaproteobacteria bacterium]|nr:nucleoside triphosphate pyrophosphohydrolase [Alphaproteobacteria bacterium]